MCENKKKNIVLLDIYAYYVKPFLHFDTVNISMLLVDSCRISNRVKQEFPGRVENFYYRIFNTNAEFNDFHKTEYNLTFEEIEEYRATQLKVEHYLQRELSDFNTIQYRYYTALAYWLDFFSKNEIDLVFSTNAEHGGIWDSIVIDIAKKKNIPVYIVTALSAKREAAICSVFNYTTRKFIDISDCSFGCFDYRSHFQDLNANNLKTVVSQPDTISLVDRIKKYYKKIFHKQKLVDTFLEETKMYQYWYNLSKREIEKNSCFMQQMKEIYQFVADKPDFSEKFIYFSLHLEPEASILARSHLNSQLTFIKWLSDALPDDWKIYVKDHPAQYNLRGVLFYLLRNITFFRNFTFYKTLMDIPKVKIIFLETSDDELVENSQAIMSIAGSVIFKAILKKKPVLLSGNGMHALENLKEVYPITGKETVKKAVDDICNGQTVLYEDFENTLYKYCFMSCNYSFMDGFSTQTIIKLLNMCLNSSEQ